MATKRISSAAKKLQETHKKAVAAARKTVAREADAKIRSYNRKMNPERFLAPDQETRVKGIVSRALKSVGKTRDDLSLTNIHDLEGFVRGFHPDYIKRNSRVNYSAIHGKLLTAENWYGVGKINKLLFAAEKEAEKTFWKRKP
ncbi:MAG: hypothetical protein NUV57_02520 [archaeon]|nr:hypothetical protein [archaeon]